MAKRHSTRIGLEAAEASRASTGKQRRGYPNALVATARGIERLYTKKRKLNAELRRVVASIKHEKKLLKAMAGAEERDL